MSATLKITLSVALGAGLGALIGYWWANWTRALFKGPNSLEIQKKIYHDAKTGNHYRFRPVPHVCPPSVDVDALEHSSVSDSDDDE
jgi:hypothetical protein